MLDLQLVGPEADAIAALYRIGIVLDLTDVNTEPDAAVGAVRVTAAAHPTVPAMAPPAQ